MRLSLYDENGFLNAPEILKINVPFIFVIGARGVGKTYGFLKEFVEKNIRFILMRRTQSQLDIISKKEFSPFNKINRDCGTDIVPRSLSKYNCGFYREEEEGGLPQGIGVALSTISNTRGFDASETEVLLYDEFIPEAHERPIRDEGAALFNAYETVNRNRELEGKPPLKLIGLANSNRLDNAVFLSLGIVGKVHEMEEKGQSACIMRDRGIAIIYCHDSPISEKKKETALYKATSGSDYQKMAIENKFEREESEIIKSRNLKEFKPIVTVGEITIYKHKSKNEYYVSEHASGAPNVYGVGDVELKRFQRNYNYMWKAYLERKFVFESVVCKILFDKYYN